MLRTLEQVHGDHGDSAALRGLIGVMRDKLELRARYALLEYEAGMEGRADCSALYRLLSQAESAQIERLSAALVDELRQETGR